MEIFRRALLIVCYWIPNDLLKRKAAQSASGVPFPCTYPVVGFAEEGGQIFDQRLPERADGGIDAVADKGFPELVHLVGKVLLPDGAAQHHELIAADAVSFAGEDFVQGVGGAADEGIPGLVAEAVVAVLETVQVHVNAADLPQRRFLPAAQVLHVAVAVGKARQHIDITELIQPLLRLFLLQTVGHEELDGGQ